MTSMEGQICVIKLEQIYVSRLLTVILVLKSGDLSILISTTVVVVIGDSQKYNS